MRMRRAVSILLCSLACGSILFGQLAKSYRLESIPQSSLPQTNVVNDIVAKGDTVWFGTDKGLDRLNGQTSLWSHFANTGTFDSKGISAIALHDEIIWVATAYSVTLNDQSMAAGGGLHYSTDRGQTWSFISQPLDVGLVDTLTYGINRIKALDITTEANNVTYDIALTKNTVWTANFAGMLRKSTNRGTSWERVVLPPDGNPSQIKPSDTLDFDLSPSGGRSGLRQNLNHRVFSLFASDDSTIWVGTAGGINKSTDGGISWQKFSHQNQSQPISGNFVVAINEQRFGSKRILWAATVNAEHPDETRGVSFTQDGGATWSTCLLGEFAHNIAVRDSIVYVATDNGVFRSSDTGNSWTKNGTVYDQMKLSRFAGDACYAVAVEDDTVWVGGPEGTASTLDNATHPFGSQWKVFRTYQAVAGTPNRTYSFPSPFSAASEVVRIHYGVAASLNTAPTPSSNVVGIRIFDFAMQPVRILLQNAPRQTGSEYDEIWDGRDDRNRIVANGVYFYNVNTGGSGESYWGKIYVVR